MEKVDNFNKYLKLRKEFTYLIYEKYSIAEKPDALEISFHFNLSDRYFFAPTISVPKKSFYKIHVDELKNIVFHIGMIELISYWKTACPGKIIIKPHGLSKKQIKWWKKLYFKGLGEFLYLNSIQTSQEDLVEIVADFENVLPKQNFVVDDSTIIPIGGGKDSIVTLELLSGVNKNNTGFILNHREASFKTIEKSGILRENVIEFKRTIHPELLKLNEKGFLNGHTPFSALLAFLTVLAAVISGKKNIALSNESSANESTVADVNHQYSKSFEFEKDFRTYLKQYITDDINYFSFLRPLNELQIAKLFSRFNKYHDVFRSCNVGSNSNVWCGKCPKCLFAFIILSPFISQDKLESIFRKNLFNDEQLVRYFDELIGVSETKPFECIGTIDEVNVALCLAIDKLDKTNLPYLLKYYKSLESYSKYKAMDNDKMMHDFHSTHFLTPKLTALLKAELK